MSVINQMLKDLEQRNQDEQANTNTHQPVVIQSTSTKPWLLILGILLLVNIAGGLIWWLYQENQLLKEQSFVHQKVSADNVMPVSESGDEPKIAHKVSSNQENAVEADTQVAQVNQNANAPVAAKNTSTITADVNDTFTVDIVQNNQSNSEARNAKNVVNDNEPPLESKTEASQVNKASTEKKPVLTIARKQLTAEALVRQKSKAAQQAIELNNMKRAESLLEEILLIQPEHHSSRKQLAALWFGRQDMRAALNLLSQGIALAPNYLEFRMMQARIYLKEGLHKKALASLMPVAHTDDVAFQSFLATIAQQAGENKQASTAYERLTQLQPTQGKWWLGYAVALDRDGEFSHAKQAYLKASATDDISESTRQFIRQRLSELGE
ncbi:tetratricopeptide repeat protein [Thalassotalea sediminis]|uniref:tetratricopeptide repeat protein n=1 Tax=Thalassotalea sediminis TaxID=1759089 RepID=UPI002573519A|nr:tetratricopeptide repeat protein [Thalassotalea sediminis]